MWLKKSGEIDLEKNRKNQSKITEKPWENFWKIAENTAIFGITLSEKFEKKLRVWLKNSKTFKKNLKKCLGIPTKN